MAIDALAAGLVGGLADTSAAAGAAFGAADLGAATAADVSLGALGAADVGAATVPEFAAADAGTLGAADLGAADATFGTFSPDLFAANSADVAAGGLGTDVGAASDLAAGGSGVLADTTGLSGSFADTAAAGTVGDTTGFFGGTGSDLFSGEGLGGGFGDIGTSTFQPFGDTFSADAATGQTGGQAGTFGGGTAGGGAGGAGGTAPGSWADFNPGGTSFDTSGAQGFGEASNQDVVSADQGIVDTGNRFDQTFNQFTTTDQGASLPTDMANRVGVNAVPTQSTTLESAFPGSTQSITGEIPAASETTTIGQPLGTVGTMQQGQLGTMMDVGLPSSNVMTAQEAFAPLDATTATAANPLPAATDVTAAPGSVPATAANTGAPTVAGAPATGSSVPASPAAVANAGTSPLNALRYGAAGLNLATAGINLSNALNQPSYTALQPQYYPGSPIASYAGPYSGQTPLGEGGISGTGGIAGGLAANRLTNSLVSGASPQQLAASGLISPQRATQLQSDYTGITNQYARELGVSPQSLSPGIRQMIAAQALADNNLGGR